MYDIVSSQVPSEWSLKQNETEALENVIGLIVEQHNKLYTINFWLLATAHGSGKVMAMVAVASAVDAKNEINAIPLNSGKWTHEHRPQKWRNAW